MFLDLLKTKHLFVPGHSFSLNKHMAIKQSHPGLRMAFDKWVVTAIPTPVASTFYPPHRAQQHNT